MIDKEFLQGCTDEQINKGVAWCEASKADCLTDDFTHNDRLSTTQRGHIKSNSAWHADIHPDFTPCTSPNDAWPIMMANNIVTVPNNEDSRVVGKNLSTECIAVWVDSNDKLLRAAMEVYLLMSNEK